jgi:flagellar protein FlgJ
MAIGGIDKSAFDTAALGIGNEGTAQAARDKGAFDSLLKRFEAIKESGPTSPVAGAKPVIDKTDKLYEQCEALESFLVKNLLNSMRSTVEKSGLIDEGFAGGMYEDMLYDEYAKEFTKNANLGFAEIAYLELSGQRGQIINKKF